MATKRSEKVLEAALGLSPKERAQLASELMASLDAEEDREPGWEEAWTAEITRRTGEIREGRVELEDGDKVLRELEAELAARAPRRSRPAKSKSTRRSPSK